MAISKSNYQIVELIQYGLIYFAENLNVFFGDITSIL